MVVTTLEVSIGERLEERDPALVESGDHCEGAIDGETAVGEAGPGGFVVGLDGGPVFREREFGADEGVGVAVGDVVHELADGPAAIAVGSIELRVAESADGGLKGGWKLAEDGDLLCTDGGFRGIGRLEAANWIAEIFEFWHCATT